MISNPMFLTTKDEEKNSIYIPVNSFNQHTMSFPIHVQLFSTHSETSVRSIYTTPQSFDCNQGPYAENSGDIDFSLCKTRVYAQHCGDIFMVKVSPTKSPAQIPAGKYEITPASTWNQNPSGSKALQGQSWDQNMALK